MAVKFRFCFRILIMLFISLFLSSNLIYSALPVIPGEEGFGLTTPAGRGGDVYEITSLADSGNGTLRECVEASGPRTCVFSISGTIDLDSHLKITNPYITIAGQTAPSPGIMLKSATLIVQTSNVLVQHLRSRFGDQNTSVISYDDRDAFKIGPTTDIYNVVFDHLSGSWATDEVFSAWSDYGSINNVTIMNSIFAEGLNLSYHPHGRHSMGALIGKNTNDFLFKQNLLAFNNGRNPISREASTNIVVANNYIYHPGVGSKSKIYFGTKGTQDPFSVRATAIGNDFTYDPDDYIENSVYIEEGSYTDFLLYLKDNLGTFFSAFDPWAVVTGRTDEAIKSSSTPVPNSNFTFLNSSQTKNFVITNAGARPLDKDSVDERIIQSIGNGTGGLINSQIEVGGWPVLAENYRKVYIPEFPNEDDDNDGYTNMEDVLHMYSNWVENNFSVDPTFILSDSTPPSILNSSPSGNLTTNNITIEIQTNETGFCKYDLNSSKNYLDMNNFFSNTNSTTHTTNLINLTRNKNYNYYVKCRDELYNSMNESYLINFYINQIIVENNNSVNITINETINETVNLNQTNVNQTNITTNETIDLNQTNVTQTNITTNETENNTTITTTPTSLVVDDSSTSSSSSHSSNSFTFSISEGNTDTSKTCVPDYAYGGWSVCTNGEKHRKVTDINGCYEQTIETSFCKSDKENNNKILNAKKITVEESNTNSDIYTTNLDSNYNEIVIVDEPLKTNKKSGKNKNKEIDSAIIFDESTGVEYYARLVDQKFGDPPEYYYSLERVDESTIEELKEDGILEKTTEEKVEDDVTGILNYKYIDEVIQFILGITVIVGIFFIFRFARKHHKKKLSYWHPHIKSKHKEYNSQKYTYQGHDLNSFKNNWK